MCHVQDQNCKYKWELVSTQSKHGIIANKENRSFCDKELKGIQENQKSLVESLDICKKTKMNLSINKTILIKAQKNL